MKKRSSFIDILKRQGYEVTERKLGGGFVNDVRLITAHKGDQVFEYVLKKYGSERDVQDMLRGYDSISSKVKTPTIVYSNGKEVAYDLVKGKSIKDLILSHDPKAPEAIRLLGKELEKLHHSEKAPPRYRRGDSPDEKKMIKHVVKALQSEQITRDEANNLIRQIRKYIPKNKSIIHGDAHLGNFMYSNGELYFIDPDNVKISDYNADIGKVVHAIKRFGEERKINSRQASELSDLFLAEYNGEDPDAVELYRTRTPLIELKNRGTDFARRAIRKASGIEARVASVVILISISLIFLTTRNNLTGLIIGKIDNASSLSVIAFIIILGVIVYFLLRKRTINKKIS